MPAGWSVPQKPAQSCQTLSKGLFSFVDSNQKTAKLNLFSLHMRRVVKTWGQPAGEWGAHCGPCRAGVASVLQAEHRTMTAFILAVIVNGYTTGQVSARPSALQGRQAVATQGSAHLFQTGPGGHAAVELRPGPSLSWPLAG